MSDLTSTDYQSLFYGDAVEALPPTTVGGAATGGGLPKTELELAARLAEAWTDGKLGIEDAPGQFVPAGHRTRHVADFARDAYIYSFRYLMRRQLFAVVSQSLKRQLLDLIKQHGATPGSILLVAHSLGTVVGLDLLLGDLGSYFAKYVSVGSPLGWIAAAPNTGRMLLPVARRALVIPWIDVAAPDDAIAHIRIDEGRGFAANPFQQVTIPAGYKPPHGAYFTDDAAAHHWIDHLA